MSSSYIIILQLERGMAMIRRVDGWIWLVPYVSIHYTYLISR